MTEEMIAQAEAIPAGFHVTYAEDTAIGDGWFADLRDELGRVAESGGGHTQDAARAHLMERIERAESERATAAAPATDTRLHTLGGHVEALVEQGYAVHFGSHDGQAEAFIVKADDTALAHGKTHAEALWTVSPLHGDDVPFTVTGEGALEADLDDFNDRLNDAESRLDAMDDHGKTQRALVWTIVGLIADANPDGELAQRLAGQRAAEAASQN